MRMANIMSAISGIQGKIIDALADNSWHSARDVARLASISPYSASKYLQWFVANGVVIWKAQNSKWFEYKLNKNSFFADVKRNYSGDLESLIVNEIERAVGKRYYFRGVFAKYLYDLLDWYAKISLFELDVQRNKFSKASEELQSASDYLILLPSSIDWKLVNIALKQGPVLLLGPDYNPKKSNVVDRFRVVKMEYLLLEEYRKRNNKEFLHLYRNAIAHGLDVDKFKKLHSIKKGGAKSFIF